MAYTAQRAALPPTLCGGEDIAKIVLENDDSEESSDADSDSGPEITESYQKVVWNEPSPDPVETSLENAINTTPMKEIRQLLIDLVRTQSAVQEAVAKPLTAPIPGPGNRKRKAYETCVHCDEEYQVAENEEGDCIYHPGIREADHKHPFWTDTDYDWQEPDEEQFPEAYLWDCCSQRGDKDGCVVTRHAYANEQSKRVRPVS